MAQHTFAFLAFWCRSGLFILESQSAAFSVSHRGFGVRVCTWRRFSALIVTRNATTDLSQNRRRSFSPHLSFMFSVKQEEEEDKSLPPVPPLPELRQPLTEREKLQLKQRGDNLRRRQGIGSLKYAEFFFRYRQAYPFTRKTYPAMGGRVETGNEAWDGVDPLTGEKADWLQADDNASRLRQNERRRRDDDPSRRRLRSSTRAKRVRSSDYEYESGSGKREELSDNSAPSSDESMAEVEVTENDQILQRDLKLLMDALTQIPTPRRAAVALETMLSKPEVQYALEKFGTGAELGLTRKELAAIAVLQSAVGCRKS